MEDPYGILRGLPAINASAAVCTTSPNSAAIVGDVDNTGGITDVPSCLEESLPSYRVKQHNRGSRETHNQEVATYMKTVLAHLQTSLEISQYEHLARMAAD